MIPDPPREFDGLWQECTERLAGQLEAGGRLPVNELLLPLTLQVAASPFLRGDSLGFWHDGKERHWLPRFHFQRTKAVKRRYRLGIFAGIHGDEPAGILG